MQYKCNINAMIWNITLNSPWFEYIKEGSKVYEGRCNWKQASQYTIGDILNISHHTDPLEPPFAVEIIDIHKFDTFETALTTLGLSKVLPGIETIEEGIQIYLKYYRLSTQLENGVLIIEIKNESKSVDGR